VEDLKNKYRERVMQRFMCVSANIETGKINHRGLIDLPMYSQPVRVLARVNEDVEKVSESINKLASVLSQ
jgi:hypothetical protein